MLIDRSHRRWSLFTLAATAISSLFFLVYYRQSFQEGGNGPTGAKPVGLFFGILAFGLIIFCGLLGVRRKVRVWRIGRAQTWMRAHIWLGLLSLPLAYFHSGLHMGNGVSLWTMSVFFVVLLSGILGLILQNILPRTLLTRITAETTFEQIPQVVDVLRSEADELILDVCGPFEGVALASAEGPASSHLRILKSDGAVRGRIERVRAKSSGPIDGSAPLKTFYLEEVKPFLSRSTPRQSRLATHRSATALFAHTRMLLPETLRDTLRDLETICEERRQLNQQEVLHQWLHGWEFVHVPLSYALLVMVAVHAIVATFRYSAL